MKRLLIAVAFSISGFLWPAAASIASAGSNDKPVLVPAQHISKVLHLPCIDAAAVPQDKGKLCEVDMHMDVAAHYEFVTLAKAPVAGTAAACGSWNYRSDPIWYTFRGGFGNALIYSQLNQTTYYNGCSTSAGGANVSQWSCCFWSERWPANHGQYHKGPPGSQVLSSWNNDDYGFNVCTPFGCLMVEAIQIWMYIDINQYGSTVGVNGGWRCTYGVC